MGKLDRMNAWNESLSGIAARYRALLQAAADIQGGFRARIRPGLRAAATGSL